MSDTSIPSIRTFQMDASTVGLLKSSVNLFRGDVNYTQNLFSMPGRNDKDGLQIDISIQYQSNIHQQATTWNREAPTGILGLGWSLPLSVITADTDSFPVPSYSIQVAGITSALVQEPNTCMLFSLDQNLITQLHDGQMVPSAIRNAFVSRGLPLSATAVVINEKTNQWAIQDDELEQVFLLSQENGALHAYHGGESYQLANYKFWKVIYYPQYERWTVTNEAGLNMSFGGGVELTRQQNKTSRGNSIEWGVQWVDNHGTPIWRGNSAVTNGQAQYARAWRLVRSYSRFGESISYGYNEFPRDSEGLLQGVEQCVGQGGKPYTKACYLTSVTDVFGRKAVFDYGQKLWINDTSASPREYADSHKNKPLPDNSPNGFQDCYETLYLDNITVQHSDGRTLFLLRFFFEPSPEDGDCKAVANVVGTSGDFCKRFLTGFRLYNSDGGSLPGYLFDYYLKSDQINPGALMSITWPSGGTALYAYKAADLQICQRTVSLTPPAPMPSNSIPRAWFGPDYAVVLWYSSSASRMSMQIMTWNGQWQAWQIDTSSPLLIDGKGTSLSSLQVLTANDFIAVAYNTSTDTNMHLFRKDPARPAQWVAAEIPGGGSGSCNDPTWHWPLNAGKVEIQAGRSFVVVSQMSTSQNDGSYTLFTWNWSKAAWEYYRQAVSSYNWVSAGSDYLLTLDMNSHVILQYITPLGDWHTGGTADLGFKLNNFTSLALCGGKAMTAVSHLTSGGPSTGAQSYDVYLLQWNNAYTIITPSKFSFKDMVDQKYPTSWNPAIIDDSLVVAAGNLMRFNGSTWQTNSNLKPVALKQGWQQRYTYGSDFAAMVYTGTGQPTAQLVGYDANDNGSSWNNPAAAINGLYNPTSNQSTANWPSGANADYITVGNLLFFRGTETNWENAVKIPLCDMQAALNGKEDSGERYQLNTASMINQGPNFLACAVYDNTKPSTGQATAVTALVLQSGSIRGEPSLLGKRMWTEQESSTSGQGTFPGGPSAFVTYPDTSKNFDAAGMIFLNRYAGDDIQGPISDWPVCSITIDDGLSERFTTSYVQDVATAACDANGKVVKYYQSTVYPGGSPDSPVNGSVVSRYLNGNKACTIANYYNMLDGLLQSVSILDANGNILKQITNTWQAWVKRAGDPVDIKAPPRQLYGAYILQTAKQTVKDGVTSTIQTGYMPKGFDYTFTGQPAAVSTSTLNGDGQIEENIQQNIYACEVNEACLAINDLSSVVQQTTSQAGVTTASSVTTLAAWPSIWGQDVCVPAEESDFGWVGGSSVFPFITYQRGQIPAGFQIITSILQRDTAGGVLEQMDGSATCMSTIFGKILGFPVATFKGARRMECAWNGFQSYEDQQGWTLEKTLLCTTRAYLGTQCLNMPQGASVRTSVTPAGRTRYLLGFRYQTPTGYASEKSGFTITAESTTIVIPFADTKGQWSYVTQAVDLPAGTGSISLQGINQSSDAVLLDGILLVPFGTDVTIRSWYADTRLLHATMNTSGAVNLTLYDAFNRTLGAVGPDNNLQELDFRFFSRQGSLNDSFDNANPNTEVTLHIEGGGRAENFAAGDEWMVWWTPGNKAIWQTSEGILIKANATPDTLTWEGNKSAFPAGVFFIELTCINDLSGPVSILFGNSQTISWHPQNGWSWVDAMGNTVQIPIASAPCMASRWLLVLKDETSLFFGDGQLLFSQTSSAVPANGFIFSTGPNALQIRNLAFGAGPRLGVSYSDGASRQRQVHQLCGNDSRIMEIIYDALDRQVASTRVAPGSFGTGRNIPIMHYRDTFVNVPAFLDSMKNTWQMTGDVANYYQGQSEGPVNRSNDQGYPYSGLRYESSPQKRIIESGKPGKELAIHDINTSSPAQRHTIYTAYNASEPDDVLPAGHFYGQSTTTPGGSTGRILADTANRAMSTRQKDACGNVVGQTQNILSYSEGSEQAGIKSTLRLPNYFGGGLDADAFVRTTLQNPLGQVTCCADPDTMSTRYMLNGKGQTRFIQVATEPDKPYYLYIRYDSLGRIMEEGTVETSWNELLLSAQIDNEAFPAQGDGAVVARSYIYDGDGTDPNSLGRLVRVTTYNRVSTLCTVTEKWTYDSQGRVITSNLDISGEVNHSAKVTYHYNNLNEIIRVDLPTGSPLTAITYTYNDQGNIISIGIPDYPDALAAYTWSADGQLLAMTRGALLDVWNYDSAGNILLHQVMAGSKPLFSQKYTYTYDSLVATRQTLSSMGLTDSKRDVTYTYDGQQRLASADVGDGFSGNQAVSQYDSNGNIFAGYQDGKPFYMTYADGTDRLSAATLADGSTASFQYRNDGYPTQWRGMTMIYDPALCIAAKVVNGSMTVQYARGLNNYRTVRQSDKDLTITLQGAGSAPLVMWINGQPQICIWGPNGLVGIHNGAMQNAVSDHQHTVWGVADSDGNPLACFDYLPFGGLISQNGSIAGCWQFTYQGKPWEADIGLYDFGARLYDPSLMRFLSPDPARQYSSPYVFAGNNPMNLTDPSGNISVWGQVGIGILMAGLFIGGLVVSTLTFGVAAAPTAAAEGALAGAIVGGETTATVAEIAAAGSTAALAEVVAGPAAGVDIGALLTSAVAAANDIYSLGWSILGGAISGAGSSGLSYDMQHGRDFTAKGFFEAIGTGALTGAVYGGFSGLASIKATINLTKSMGVTYKVLCRTLTQGSMNMLGKDISNLLGDAVTGQKVTTSQMLRSSAEAFLLGCASGGLSATKSISPNATAVSKSDTILIKASTMINKTIDDAKSWAATTDAYAVYITAGFFLPTSYGVWGLYTYETNKDK